MLFTLNNLGRCSGGNHVELTVTVNGQQHVVQCTQADIDLEPDELRAAVIARVRSAWKESSGTPAQRRAAIISKDYQV